MRSLEMADQEALGDDVLLLRRKRALYRAQHRGTKEMDWMLGRYAGQRLAKMSGGDLDIFEAFLEIGDPEINAWLFDPSQCDQAAFAALVADIRSFNSLG
jgi:antitoxin CptB